MGVWKRASKKAKPSSKRRMKAVRKQVYTPYPSIRGTNPENQTTFKGKGFPDRLTTNVVYSIHLFSILRLAHPRRIKHIFSRRDTIRQCCWRWPTYVLGSTLYSVFSLQG